MTDKLFIDESLAKGLTNNWIRIIKARNDRKRTLESQRKLTQLKYQFKRGIAPKKRREHYIQFLNELTKARVTIPYVLPSTEDHKTPSAMLDVNINNHGGIEHLVLTTILLDYHTREFLFEVKDNHNENPTIQIRSHHVLSRYLQRENTNELQSALLNIYDSIINSHDTINQREEGPCNLWLGNGGMLLGEVSPNQFNENKYTAHTYISSGAVRPHNLVNAIRPYADVESSDYKFMRLNEDQIVDLKRLMDPTEFERVMAHNEYREI